MKHRGLTGLVASSVAGLLLLGFACVDADIPNVSNRLRDALEETYGNAGAPPVAGGGDGGSASTPTAGAGGAPDDGEDPEPDDNGGAAGSSMAGMAGGDGEGAAGAGGAGGAGGGEPPPGDDCGGFALLQRTCGLSGCHAPENAPFGGFAASEESARSYIGVEGRITCAGQGPLFDPGDPENSVVVLKASGEADCGSSMPPAGGPAPLTEDELACVVEWIGTLAE
ncbi:MAG TPA: hypothetical protein VMG12_31035 [Polyangiaceae bacterium]|nr:hypothetical protein [Polyangiaceae bacterium]